MPAKKRQPRKEKETEVEPPKNPLKTKKRTYKSEEARARQLAGLSGVRVQDHVNVEIEKSNGKGALATIPDDVKKNVIDLYCKGHAEKAICEATGLDKGTITAIKQHQLDHDSQFRQVNFRNSIREKLNAASHGVADRVMSLLDEMSAKDAAIALGIMMDKLAQLDKDKGAETLHQHIHLHAPKDLNKAFENALKGQI